MTTHTIASWRDLTDQLTAEQIARLERDEARGEPRDNPAELLSQARWGAARNAAQARYADVPMPGGMEASVWAGGEFGDDDWTRHLSRALYDTPECSIELGYAQNTDGRITDRYIYLNADNPLTADEATAAGTALLAAAVELNAPAGETADPASVGAEDAERADLLADGDIAELVADPVQRDAEGWRTDWRELFPATSEQCRREATVLLAAAAKIDREAGETEATVPEAAEGTINR